jgi:hypothetical protein
VQRACSTYGTQGKCRQDFGGETEGKRSLERSKSRREDNINMDLREMEWGAWAGSTWVRTGTNGGLL